eukprot:TRINITY_DN47211_c0_g1_i1.p1 TRINITY_DN47211_c0_g1~~TRINITY_DN47211_c0_g1_i1.p1  ORF type:complete len:614 (+),score=190.35 TRINITY_DN47211_c0_g1_i1:40-1842(+)
MKLPQDLSPAPVVFPPDIWKGCEETNDNYRWIVVKVDTRLGDWREALQGTQLRTGGGAKINGCSETVIAIDDGDIDKERGQLLLLRPLEPGSNKLTSVGESVSSLVRVTLGPKTKRKAAPAAEDAGDGDGFLRIKTMPESQLHAAMLALWRVGPPCTASALEQLRMRSFQASDGKKTLQGKFADAPGMQLVGSVLRTPKATGSGLNWKYLIGCVQEGSDKLRLHEAEFFIIDRDSNSFEHIQAMNAYGQAVVAEGDDDDEEAAPSMAQKKPVSYKNLRQLATQGFGTSQRQRQTAQEASRVLTADQVKGAISEEQMTQLRKEAEEHAASHASTLHDQEVEKLREILPAFDLEAKTASEIYKAGLDAVVTTTNLQNEEAAFRTLMVNNGEPLIKMLTCPPEKVRRTSAAQFAEEVCKSALVYTVLLARADGGVRAASEEEAKFLLSHMGFLTWLEEIYISRRRKGDVAFFRKGELEKKLPLQNGPMLGSLFKYFFAPVRNDQSTRQVLEGKVLSHALVWALHLTPHFGFNAGLLLDNKRLRLDAPELKKYLEACGCIISEKKAKVAAAGGGIEKMDARLKAPLTIQTVRVMSGKKKKGGGR